MITVPEVRPPKNYCKYSCYEFQNSDKNTTSRTENKLVLTHFIKFFYIISNAFVNVQKNFTINAMKSSLARIKLKIFNTKLLRGAKIQSYLQLVL